MPTGRVASRHTQDNVSGPVKAVCLVAGEACGVTHIMGGIMQSGSLNVAGQ